MMRFLKTLFFCFLIVFFADYLIPGIDVAHQTKIPYIRGDLIFAAALGLLNAIVVPLLGLFDGYLTKPRIGIVSLILNFAAYALLKLLPLGVFVTTVKGYVSAALVTSILCFVVHYLEIRRHPPKIGPHHVGTSPL